MTALPKTSPLSGLPDSEPVNPIRNPSPPGRAASQWAGISTADDAQHQEHKPDSTADAERETRIRWLLEDRFGGYVINDEQLADWNFCIRLLDEARAEIAWLRALEPPEDFAEIEEKYGLTPDVMIERAIEEIRAARTLANPIGGRRDMNGGGRPRGGGVLGVSEQEAALALLRGGMTYKAVADAFGVSRNTIAGIRHRHGERTRTDDRAPRGGARADPRRRQAGKRDGPAGFPTGPL